MVAKGLTKLIRQRGKAPLPSISSTSGFALSEDALQAQVRSTTVDQSVAVGSEVAISPTSFDPQAASTDPSDHATGQNNEVGLPRPGRSASVSSDMEATALLREDQEVVSSDNIRSVERYMKAVENMKKALELARGHWEIFELDQFDSLPFGDKGNDIKMLQTQIDKVLESRSSASKNPAKWRKVKATLENCFRALAPFLKNAFSVSQSAAQVNPTQNYDKVDGRSLC